MQRKLKKDDKAHQDYLEKDWLRKRSKRLENKQKPLPEQEAHKVAERNRVRNYRIQKKKAEETKAVSFASDTPYCLRQSTGKAWEKLKNHYYTLLEKETFFLEKWQQKLDFRLRE